MCSAVDDENMCYLPLSNVKDVLSDVNDCSDKYSLLTSDVNTDCKIFNESSNFIENVMNDNIHYNNNNSLMNEEDDIYSMKLCSNCLNDFNTKSEEYFENDECGHILCVKCRFVQDNVCKLCKMKQQEELESSVALDLTTSYSSNSNELNSCSTNCLNSKTKKTKKKGRYYQLPDFIHIVSREPPQYQCSICQKKFGYKLQAKYHEACSTGQRPLKCDLCEKTFLKKSHLEYHMRTHSGDRPFICCICDKGFIQKNKLNRHMKIHSGQREVFKCEKCNLCLYSKQRFEIHVRIHTNERPFHCKHCQRTFRDKQSLSTHETFKHSDARNFVCEDCGKAFKVKSNLLKHQRTSTHQGYRPHHCNINGCSSRFANRRDLLRHMQTQIHSTDLEYDYECSICMTGFRRKDNLERHMKITHPESVTELGNKRQIVTVVKVKDLIVSPDNNNISKDKCDDSITGDKNIPSEERPAPKSGMSKENCSTKIKKPRKTVKKLSCTKVKKSLVNPISHTGESCNKLIILDNENNIGSETPVVDKNTEIPEINNEQISVPFVEKHNRETFNSVAEDFLLSFSSTNVNDTSVQEKQNTVVERETVPKFQKVSVISNSKKYVNDAKILLKKSIASNESCSKKTTTIAPFRLIKPSIKSSNVDGSNCVPTITKVTHIVHTSETGVPNIKTVITTRDVTEKLKTDKPKQKKSTSNNIYGTENNLNSGVIKYVPKSSKNTAPMKHKCYRLLDQSSNSSIVTCSFNKSNLGNNDLSMIGQPINSVRNDRVQPEIDLFVRNIPNNLNNFNSGLNDYNGGSVNYHSVFNNTSEYENIQSHYDYTPGNLLNNFGNNPREETEATFEQYQNENFSNSSEINYDPSTSVIYNSSQSVQPFSGNVSETCFLAENSLDESLTAALYLENYNNSIVDNYNNSTSDFVNNYQSVHLDGSNKTQFGSHNYSNSNFPLPDCLNISSDNNNASPNIPSNLSSETDVYDYQCINDTARNFNDATHSIINEINGHQIIQNGIQQSSQPYFYENSYDDNVFGSLKNVNFNGCSENLVQIMGNNPNLMFDSCEQNDLENNGLCTLADMACERENL